MRGAGEWGLWYNVSSPLLLRGYSLLPLLPWNAVLPALFLCGLPSGCSSPSIAPIQLCTTGPTLWALLHTGPHSQQLPQPSCLTAGFSLQTAAPAQCAPWAVPPSGLIHCYTTDSSMAACGDLLHMLPMACRGTACSTTGLSWAEGCCCSVPRAPPALLLHRPWGPQGCFSHIFFHSHSCLRAVFTLQ